MKRASRFERQRAVERVQLSEKDGKTNKMAKKTTLDAEQAHGNQDAEKSLAEGQDNKGSKAQYSLKPDTQRIENTENLDERGAVVAPDSDEVQFAWDICELPSIPRNILASATLKPELYLEVRKHRKRASEALQKISLQQGLCPHVGTVSIVFCRAP